MIDSIWQTVTSYWTFYERYFAEQWHHMSPVKYGSILISIGVFGWLLMKSGNKRS